MTVFLAPGPAHPHPPLATEDLADRMDVSVAEVLEWIRLGLPTRDGLIDPFVASNWLCWGHLERCPLLARRWQSYLRWFMPHVHAEDTPQRYRVRQAHRLYLPEPVDDLQWYIPRLPVCTDQPEVHIERMPQPRDGSDVEVSPAGAFTRVAWKREVSEPEVAGEAVVQVQPRPIDLFPDHAVMVRIVTDLVEDFHYEYRHHLPDEDLTVKRVRGVDGIAGSCLDCALELGRRLDDIHRPWKLCSGVIASSSLANPHFWLKVDTTSGWVPVDPSLPAIARMLGADWRAFVDAYVGGCDSRRITLADMDLHVPGLPEGPSLGSRIGEAIVTVSGERRNAWACMDWVCGECLWSFH